MNKFEPNKIVLTAAWCLLLSISPCFGLEIGQKSSIQTGVDVEKTHIDVTYNNGGVGTSSVLLDMERINYQTLSTSHAILFSDFAEIELGLLHGIGLQSSRLNLSTPGTNFTWNIQGEKPRKTEAHLKLKCFVPLTEKIKLAPEIKHTRGKTNLGHFRQELSDGIGATNLFDWNARFNHHQTHVGTCIHYKITEKCGISYGLFYVWKYLNNQHQYATNGVLLDQIEFDRFRIQGFSHLLSVYHQLSNNWCIQASVSMENLKSNNTVNAVVEQGANTINKTSAQQNHFSANLGIQFNY